MTTKMITTKGGGGLTVAPLEYYNDFIDLNAVRASATIFL